VGRDWPAQFETAVRGHLADPPPLGELDPDLDLAAAGVDSLETIGLITDIEEAFAITLPDEALTVETFATPQALWQAVAACLSGQDAPA
jgi:acyl carrier protein